MRVLITGAGGLVGRALCRTIPDGIEAIGLIHEAPAEPGVPTERADLAAPGAFASAVERTAPELVIHCAHRLADGQRNIVESSTRVAQACGASGIALVHMSSDLVFDGESGPFDESSPRNPVFEHGRFKQAAEDAAMTAVPDVAIVRTSVVVSLDPVDVVTDRAVQSVRRGEPVTFFDDEIRKPILLDDLVASLWEIVGLTRADRAGVWHVAGPTALTRSELGVLIIAWFDLDRTLIHKASAASLGTKRPRDTSLSCNRAERRLSVRPRALDTVTAHGQASG